MSWLSELNGSHFGLPTSSIHKMPKEFCVNCDLWHGGSILRKASLALNFFTCTCSSRPSVAWETSTWEWSRVIVAECVFITQISVFHALHNVCAKYDKKKEHICQGPKRFLSGMRILRQYWFLFGFFLTHITACVCWYAFKKRYSSLIVLDAPSYCCRL